MRLDKYLAHATGLTRSRAHGMIRSGQVTVDGEVVKIVGFKVPDGAEVAWRDQTIELSGKRYFMLNKPKGVVCATSDAEHKTVLDLLDIGNKKDLHVAGRLDIDTTGLVLITDDGDWSHRITSPKHKYPKTYRVTLAEPLEASLVECFAEGIALRNEEKPTRPATLEILSPTEARLTISEGKYHQVKRMFAAVGNHVVALHRERIGVIALDPEMLSGQWRALSEEEIGSMLRAPS
jgi:16S rRNA pseudouridine516 synthase